MGEHSQVRIQEMNNEPFFGSHGRRQGSPGRRRRSSSAKLRRSAGRPFDRAALVALLIATSVPLAIPAAAHVEEEFEPLTVTDYEFHSSEKLPAAALSVTILDMDPDAIECTVSMGMATSFYRRSMGPINTAIADGMPRAWGAGWVNGVKAEALGIGTYVVYDQVQEITGSSGSAMARRTTYTPSAFRYWGPGDMTLSMASANLYPFPNPANPTTGPDTMLLTLHCSDPVDILFHASRQALLHSQATFDSALLYTEMQFRANVVMGAESQRTFEGERVEISAGPAPMEPQPLWEGALQVDGPGGHHEWDFFTDEWFWTRTGEPGTYTFRLDRRAIGISDVHRNLWLLAVAWQPVQDLTAVFELPGFSEEITNR